MASGELLYEQLAPVRGRLAPWDNEGSRLVWSHAFMGPPSGEIIPFGRSLANAVGAAVSNLMVTAVPGRGLKIQVAR